MNAGRGTGETSQDFVDFLEHISRDVKFKDGFLIGSTAELPMEYVLAKMEDFTVDQLQFSRNECALWPEDAPPANFKGTVFVVEPACALPGFARLRKPDRRVGPRRDAQYLSFGEMTTTSSRMEPLIDFLGVKAAFRQRDTSRQGFLSFDGLRLNIQGAITCLSWPPEASEWKTRKRAYGWPAQDLLENVVKGGCHLVPVRSPSSSCDNTVFRVSFARAEVPLIYAWTPVQKYIYHVLRLIKGDVVKQLELQGHRNVMCTYHFKTMMLWACETMPPAFWDESRIKSSVGELLCQMIELLVDRKCPNYFIPSINLMDHLPESLDINAVIMPLLVFKEQGAARLIATVPMSDPDSKSTIQMSKKLINLAQFSADSVSKHAGHRRSTGKFCEEPTKKNFADQTELSSLFNGVAAHLRLARNSHCNRESNTVRSSPSDYEMAVTNLEHAMLADTREFACRQISLGDALPEVLCSMLLSGDRNTEVCSMRSANMVSKTGDRPISKGDTACHAPAATSLLDESRLQASCKDSETARYRAANGSSKVIPTSLELSKTDKFEERACAEKKAAHSSFQFSLNLAINLILPAFDLMFPKASSFVSAAYRANFFYSYCHNYQLALQICEETLRRIQATKIDSAVTYIHDICSVVLAPKWMPLFDKQIQAIYGFVVLSQSLNRKGRKRSPAEKLAGWRSSAANDFDQYAPVHYLSPIEFMEYIKMRCEAELLQYRVSSAFGTNHRCFSYRFSCAKRSRFILLAALDISTKRAFLNSYSTPTWNPYATGYNW